VLRESVGDIVEAVRPIPSLARARCRASYEARLCHDVVGVC
jgi:hypothetical protein